MTTLTSTAKLGDLLKMETDYRYTRRAGTWTNGTGSSVTLRLGQPFSVDESTGVLTEVDDGSEANVEALLLTPVDVVVANGESVDLSVLVRGPALINKDALPDTAIDGGTFDKGALATALEALSPPIMTLVEPASSATEEQTT